MHPAPPFGLTKLLMPTPQGRRPPSNPFGWSGLIYGLRWSKWIPLSSRAWTLPREGPEIVVAWTVSVGLVRQGGGGVGGRPYNEAHKIGPDSDSRFSVGENVS
jgi:hypothetical protein